MPVSALNWKDRRSISENSKSSPEILSRAGRELFQAGFLVEAIELFQKANDASQLEQVKAASVQEGNFFIYVRACQALGKPAMATELKQLAAQAAKEGLLVYESKARSLLEGSQPSS
ncbi:MAG: hypothetical protein LBT47_02245 [Deltaproteobacteria bacterium]|jgi:hypothetical protein|nr:hypothetical protein [Deltaproteobacteria bacterium]